MSSFASSLTAVFICLALISSGCSSLTHKKREEHRQQVNALQTMTPIETGKRANTDAELERKLENMKE